MSPAAYFFLCRRKSCCGFSRRIGKGCPLLLSHIHASPLFNACIDPGMEACFISPYFLSVDAGSLPMAIIRLTCSTADRFMRSGSVVTMKKLFRSFGILKNEVSTAAGIRWCASSKMNQCGWPRVARSSSNTARSLLKKCGRSCKGIASVFTTTF